MNTGDFTLTYALILFMVVWVGVIFIASFLFAFFNQLKKPCRKFVWPTGKHKIIFEFTRPTSNPELNEFVERLKAAKKKNATIVLPHYIRYRIIK